MPPSLLCPDAFLSPLEIEEVVARALAEDLGRAGDVTSIATIPQDASARAVVIAREPGVVAGLPLVSAAFKKLSPEIAITSHVRDGAWVTGTSMLLVINGAGRAVLAPEWVALNRFGG